MRECFFDKPELDLSAATVIAVFTAYNEAERLPYFLNYYRELGVDHFLAIDNNSADGTAGLLQGQPDITYFHTAASYADSGAGRLWMSELAKNYAIGKWCLTVDLDEQLVYPGCEIANLKVLTRFLEEHKYDGLFTLLLDMYPAGPLSEAVYQAGQSFLDVCRYFDLSHEILRASRFPNIAFTGGPRKRHFFPDEPGPSMRKMPLVRWHEGFDYSRSTHASTRIRLAEITGALLHFKFFSTFAQFAQREVERQDRVQMDDYRRYASAADQEDIVFYGPYSKKYESSLSLLREGGLVATPQYVRFLQGTLRGPANAEEIRRIRAAAGEGQEKARLPIALLPAIWPLIQPANGYGILFANGTEIVGWSDDGSGDFSPVQASVGETLLTDTAPGSGRIHDSATIDWRARNTAYSLQIPPSVWADRNTVRVEVVSTTGESVREYVELARKPTVAAHPHYDGVCFIKEDELIGWAVDRRDLKRELWLSVLADGAYWCRVRANQRNKVLYKKNPVAGAHSFRMKLRDWVSNGVLFDVIIEGTNLKLRRSPAAFGSI